MKVFEEKEVASLIVKEEMLQAIENACLAMDSESISLPDRMHLIPSETTHLCMCAATARYYITKSISIKPVDNGKALTSGSVVLHDGDIGMPLAFMDAERLTQHRTGALAGVAVKHLSNHTNPRVGVIGAGNITSYMAKYVALVKNVEQLFIYDPQIDQVDKFFNSFLEENPNIDIRACKDATHVIKEADIVLIATTAYDGVLPNDKNLLKGKLFVAMGSYKPEMRELNNELFEVLDKVYYDTDNALRESGDLLEPLNQGIIPGEMPEPIQEAMRRNCIVSDGQTILFKAVGHALLDLYAAVCVFEKSIKNNLNPN